MTSGGDAHMVDAHGSIAAVAPAHAVSTPVTQPEAGAAAAVATAGATATATAGVDIGAVPFPSPGVLAVLFSAPLVFRDAKGGLQPLQVTHSTQHTAQHSTQHTAHSTQAAGPQGQRSVCTCVLQ